MKLDFATGVPLPPDDFIEHESTKNKIVGRQIQICLFDKERMKFRGNSINVPVVYDPRFEDEWQFKTEKDKSQV